MKERKQKILIIDDDPDFVRIAKTILQSAGYDVLEAFSGQEGLATAKKYKPDLYIIDLVMETFCEGSNIINMLMSSDESKNKPKIMISVVDLTGPWESCDLENGVFCDYVLKKPISAIQFLFSSTQL